MVDIHCHILPEFDDGSQSKQMSVEMLELAADSGITDIICTPHTYDLFDTAEHFQKYKDRLEYLDYKIKTKHIPVKLHIGAEVHVTDEFFNNPDFSRFSMAGSKYVLIEYSFTKCKIDYAIKAINAVKELGYKPIIAHPERYMYTVEDYDFVNKLAEQGVHFQVNLGSLIGELGKKEQKLAKEIVNSGMASFLASDAHRVAFRNTDFNRMLQCVPKDVDTSDFENLLTNNPLKIINGEDIPLPKYTPIEKKSFFGRKKKNVVTSGSKTYFVIEDEGEIFDIADEYLDAVENSKTDEYWKNFQ